MAKSVNTKRPIRFYDDRGKGADYIFLDKILFEDDEICLALIKGEPEEEEDLLRKIMFRKKDGQVLNVDYDSWYAENFETEELKRAKKAIAHVKNTQCDVHLKQPYLLLGDVAKLIEITTGILPTLEELEPKK